MATTVAPAATSSSSAGSSTAAAAPKAAVSTAKIAAPAATKKFALELYNKTATSQQALLDGDSSVATENYVGGTMDLGGGQKIGIRQYFNLAMPENAASNDFKMASTALRWMANDFVKPNDNLGLSTEFRAYLPTSEAARFETKENGSLRNYLFLVQKLGKFEVSGNLLSQWYSQNQDFKEPDAKGVRKPNKESYIVPYAEAAYSISESLTVTQGIGYQMTSFRAGESARVGDWYTTLSWQALKQLTVAGTLESEPNFNADRPVQLYRPDETSIILELAAKL